MLEKIEKLVKEVQATEINPGSLYVVTYDMNTMSKSDALYVLGWMNKNGIKAVLVARDGSDDAMSFFKFTPEENPDAHV